MSRIDPDAVGGLGLVPALPVVYFVALALLVVSAGLLLRADEASEVRLALHVGALVVMLHGTAPLVYPEPRYAWLFKHVGVVQYIVERGHLSTSIDIYHRWPGFFAAVAWFDRIAGIGSPLRVAPWAQLVFNLLNVIVFGLATRWLDLTWRERWLAILFLAGANWVAQDYLSPQAVGYVLTLGLLALVLRWCIVDRRPRWLGRLEERLRSMARAARSAPRAERPGAPTGSSRRLRRESRVPAPVIVAIVVVFAALVVIHELSPYVVVLQLGILTVLGQMRPRWLVPLLLAIAVLYFVPQFGFVNERYGLFESIGNFFGNARPPSVRGLRLSHDQALVATAARVLSGLVWFLAVIGAWRRFRAGRPVLVLTVLAFSPFALVALQSYGGEVMLRVQLFSLPWSAALAASAFSLRAPEVRASAVALSGAALALVVALFLPAYFGADRVNTMTRADIAASRYLDARGAPGVVFYLDQNFPQQIGPRYPEFSSQTLLGPYGASSPGFELTADAVDALSFLARQYRGQAVYVVLSPKMLRYAQAYGLTDATSLEPLADAMTASADWDVFYERDGTRIFEFQR